MDTITIPNWRSIKEAPKDRLILLSMVPHRGFLQAPIKVGGWRADKNEWEIFGGSWKPTHWTLLPEPPQETNS